MALWRLSIHCLMFCLPPSHAHHEKKCFAMVPSKTAMSGASPGGGLCYPLPRLWPFCVGAKRWVTWNPIRSAGQPRRPCLEDSNTTTETGPHISKTFINVDFSCCRSRISQAAREAGKLEQSLSLCCVLCTLLALEHDLDVHLYMPQIDKGWGRSIATQHLSSAALASHADACKSRNHAITMQQRSKARENRKEKSQIHV